MARRSSSEDATPDVPTLTLGQRVLAALPPLRRPGSAPGRAAPAGPAATGTDEPPEASTAPPSPARARRTAAADPKRPFKDVPSAELVHRIKYLDDRERLAAFVAAPVGAALVLLIMFDTLHSNPPVGHKNHADPTLIVMYGLFSVLMGIVVAVAAYYRRRSFVSFALLFAGLGGSIVTIIPLWGVAIWFFTRSSRWQRELTARGENPRVQAAAERRARSTEARAGRAAGPARRSKAAEAKGPPPNKRYTPPKPTRPKIAKPET